jgi:hypothetical protein
MRIHMWVRLPLMDQDTSLKACIVSLSPILISYMMLDKQDYQICTVMNEIGKKRKKPKKSQRGLRSHIKVQ